MIKAMDMKSARGRILQMRDAAKLLDMTPDGVRRLVDIGKLPAVRTPSGQRLLYAEDVEQLAAERDAVMHERRSHVA